MKTRATIVWLLLAPALAAAGETAKPAPPQRASFTTKPTAVRNGDRVKVAFAVSAPTDVAVFIEDAKGEVVRHLVAGVLGQNPPPPLRPGLAQEIEWDGKADYGRPALSERSESNGFKVRVALGLGAKYDRVVSAKPQNLEWVAALGTGPDGTLYVRNQSSPAVWNHTQLLALDREGSYLRTLFPYPSSLTKEQASAYGVIALDGRPAPADYHGERDNTNVITGAHGPRFSTMAVSRDGREIYMLLGRRRPYAEPGIARMAVDGSCPAAPFCEPLAPGKKLGVTEKQPAAAVLSSDGRSLFFSGLSSDQGGNKALSAVHRVPVPERQGMTVFFGDPDKAGKGPDLLGGAPTGLATDGRGHLLIADPANGRVVMLGEKDGKYAGELKVEGLNCLGVSHKSGAIYVTASWKGRGQLLRFDSIAADKPSAELVLPGFEHLMTVDPVADPPVVWFGTRVGVLLRVEDKGGKFEARTISPGTKERDGTQEGYLGLVVDRLRREIYTRNGQNGGLWQRFSEKTGQLENVIVPGGAGGGGHGLQLTPAPDGNLYGIIWPYQFYRWDRDGKVLPWAEPRRPVPGKYDHTKREGVKPPLTANAAYSPVAMVELPHTLGVRWDSGNFLILENPRGARAMKALLEYLPSGQLAREQPIIWKTTDAAVGPKLDAAGNIYIAEVVRPKGWYCPPELKAALAGAVAPAGKVTDKELGALYGSIVKFGPKGGMFHFADGKTADTGPDPFEGQPRLDGLKSADYDYFRYDLRPIKVTGAEWVHPGMGHVGLYGCNCENVTFDVDEFGRVFFPDLALYRVRVIDTAGNAIMHFGGYGNPESMGPESPVLDEKTGRLRPPRPGEKSPFAQPDIAFSWLVGVGVTDRYAYMGDAMNRRLLRARLVYAAEETCAIGP